MNQPMKQPVRQVQIGEIVRLRASGSQAAPTGGEVVVVCDRNGPVIVHWGASLGGEPMLGRSEQEPNSRPIRHRSRGRTECR
jgi:hypothetical protein